MAKLLAGWQGWLASLPVSPPASLLSCGVQFIKCSVTHPYWVLKHEERWVCVCYFMCICGLAFQCKRQHFGSLSFCFTQRPVHSTELWRAAIYFNWAWWLVNGCKDMIHGLSHAHLGLSFSAPYHYKSFYIITAGNVKALSQCDWRKSGL